MDAFLDKLGVNAARTIHRFSVPESIPGEVRSVGLVELTAEDELRVEQRCKGDRDRRAAELVKTSLVEVNGKRVSVHDGSVSNLWNEMPSKVRTLINTAWIRLHMATDQELDTFFESRTSSLG